MGVQTDILRPLGMGELLDRAIRLYRRHFFKLIGVLAVMQVPVAGLTLIVNLATYDATLITLPEPAEIAEAPDPLSLLGPEYYTGTLANFLISATYLVLISGVASAALTNLVADAYVGGEVDHDSPFDAYREIGDRWSTLLRAIVLFALLAVVVFAWLLIPCVGWLTGPGMLLTLTGLVFPLLAPVVVLERNGARASLQRAWLLIRRRFWWVFGFIILLFLFNWVVVGGPSLLVGLGLGLLVPESLAGGNPQVVYNIQMSIQSVVSLVFNLLYLPLQLTCLTLLYFDLRVRQEGLDLIAASSAGVRDVPAFRSLVAGSVPAGAEPLVRVRDLLNFSLMSFLMVGLYLVLVFGLAALFLSLGVF